MVSPADLDAPFDQHHTEAAVSASDILQHRQVARLKDLQGQRTPGEQGRPQRNHRQGVHPTNIAHVDAGGQC